MIIVVRGRCVNFTHPLVKLTVMLLLVLAADQASVALNN